MKPKTTPKLLRGLNNVLEFGKHKGQTVQEIMRTDPNWLHWALQNIPDFKLNRNALLLLPPYIERDSEPYDQYGDPYPHYPYN